MPNRLVAELAARDSYGRLVAFVATRSRDLASAEDALSEAFLAALRTWPTTGVPDNPEGWLLAAARRRRIDAARRDRTRQAAVDALGRAAERAQATPPGEPAVPDERLQLMLLCADPAVDEAARTPLMLQAVLGLDAARIGSAFLVAPAAMGQRLVRAKARLRETAARFDDPSAADLPARLGAVLSAVYVAFGIGWDAAAGADPDRRGLADEAVWLAGLVADLAPDDPEAGGLHALLLYCDARRSARRTAAGKYVPLSDQDPGWWDWEKVGRAEQALATAARHGRPGRFQLEAAIQSAHTLRGVTGATDWPAVGGLYAALMRAAPSAGARVGWAAAVAEVDGPAAGLAILGELPAAAVAGYQPYWAVAADLLRRAGRPAEAKAAYTRAVGLAEDPAVREFLASRGAGL